MIDSIGFREMTKERIVYLFVGIIIVQSVTLTTYSQFYETEITQIVDEHGHSPGATFAIAEDSLGFIWFGTTDGLYRYDGYNLKVFRNIPENDSSLSNNTIRGLCFDRKGLLWISTQGGGLDCFNVLEEKFTHYKSTGKSENELSGNSLWAVMADHSDRIWVGVTGKGIDCLNRKTLLFSHYDPLPGDMKLRQEQTIRSLIESRTGLIWAGIPDYGLISINPSTGGVQHYSAEASEGYGLSNLAIYELLTDPSGKIWISTYGGGMNIYDPLERTYQYITQEEEGISSDLVYSTTRKGDELWLGTEYGITVYPIHDGKIQVYKKGVGMGINLSENRIRKMFVDSQGIVWAGSESGVDKIVSQKNFKMFRYLKDNPNSLPEGIVRAICEDHQGNIWIGLVENGLVRYNTKSGIFTHYLHDDENPYSLPGNDINALFLDGGDTLWIGDWAQGLIRYDFVRDRFIHVSRGETGRDKLIDNRIQQILEGDPGILWIGTENGITRYNKHTGRWKSYQHEEDNPNSFSGNAVQSQAFLFDREGCLWVGTWSYGLNRIEFLDSEDEHFTVSQWRHDPSDPNSLANDNVISLLEDDQGIMWVGTFGGGFCKFDTRTNTFKTYTTEEGLPNNIVFAILRDRKGKLWMSTDYGISSFDPRTESFRNYTRSDGLQDDHFFWGAACESSEGEIYLGGIYGMNSFFPEQIRPDTSPALPTIVEISLFNKPIETDRPCFILDQVAFSHDENFLTFEFAALNNTKPEQNKYRYILEGFDKGWMDPGNSHSATYTNLSPGNYMLRVRTANSYGVWSDREARLKVIIYPPWWKTWWFITLFALLSVFLVYSVINLRFRILSRQKQNLEREVAERTFEITKKNVLLEKRTNEIRDRNEQLNTQKKELAAKNEKLKQTLTTLEQTQRALLESEKMASLGVLTAGVAHEINNPLNFIALSIDNLKAELAEMDFSNSSNISEEDLRILDDLMGHAEHGVDRILRITDRLKAYARKADESEEVFDVDEMIASSLKLIQSKFPARIILEQKLEKVPLIRGHKYQISQVIINIVDNAIDAISETTKREQDFISIQTSEEIRNDAKYVLIEICNSGPAIPEKVLKNIFDPFFTTKAPNKGTGLGLYLSYNIIKEHKGFFSVENKNKKVNFKILLPAHIQ